MAKIFTPYTGGPEFREAEVIAPPPTHQLRKLLQSSEKPPVEVTTFVSPDGEYYIEVPTHTPLEFVREDEDPLIQIRITDPATASCTTDSEMFKRDLTHVRGLQEVTDAYAERSVRVLNTNLTDFQERLKKAGILESVRHGTGNPTSIKSKGPRPKTTSDVLRWDASEDEGTIPMAMLPDGTTVVQLVDDKGIKTPNGVLKAALTRNTEIHRLCGQPRRTMNWELAAGTVFQNEGDPAFQVLADIAHECEIGYEPAETIEI